MCVAGTRRRQHTGQQSAGYEHEAENVRHRSIPRDVAVVAHRRLLHRRRRGRHGRVEFLRQRHAPQSSEETFRSRLISISE